jgi:transcription elongation factor Elf1
MLQGEGRRKRKRERERERERRRTSKYSKTCINCNGIIKSVNTVSSKMNLFSISGFCHSVNEIFTFLGC